MSSYMGRFLAFSAVISLSSMVASAALEPLVRLTDLRGACTVTMPDGSLAPAEEGKAYPYGSIIKTGPDSSMVAILASGTSAKILPASQLRLKGAMDSPMRVLQLDTGAIEVTLGDGIADGETLITSVLPATSITGSDCTFRVDATLEGDLTIAFVRALDGGITVDGPHYKVLSLPKGGKLALITPPDLQFIRIKNMRGEFPVTVKDSEGLDKDVKTKEGHVLKVWREAVKESDTIAVTVLVTDANGVLLDTLSSTQEQKPVMGLTTPPAGATLAGDDEPTGAPPTEPTPEPPTTPGERKRPTEEEISRPVFSPATMGTTTVPPTTPVGLE